MGTQDKGRFNCKVSEIVNPWRFFYTLNLRRLNCKPKVKVKYLVLTTECAGGYLDQGKPLS